MFALTVEQIEMAQQLYNTAEQRSTQFEKLFAAIDRYMYWGFEHDQEEWQDVEVHTVGKVLLSNGEYGYPTHIINTAPFAQFIIQQ